MAIDTRTIVPPGEIFKWKPKNKPTITEISPKMILTNINCLKLEVILIALATGKVIIAETSKIPTILIDALITKATKIIKTT